MSTDWSRHFATRAAQMHSSEIRELLKLLDKPDIISFAGGIPDPNLFPREEIAKACQDIFSDPVRSATALQYSVSEGYLPLREWLVNYMSKLGATCAPENILITNGSQQALDFIGKLFISKGDTALVAWPTYLGALQAFNIYEPRYDQLPGPGSNRTPDSYRGAGKTQPKFGYAMPEFQNPTGTSLTKEERLALLDAADALDIPLIEDSAYEHLRYSGTRAPTMLALASERAGGIDNAKVIYCGTFSKSVAPAFRIGWMVAPKHIIQRFVLIKQASDLNVSCFNQMILHEVISATFERNAARACALYKERRDTMLKALENYMPKGISWTKPEGGMFIWMTLPSHIDSAELLKKSIAEARVAFVPGAAFFPDRSGHNTIRLSFSLQQTKTIEEGIKRLGELLKGT